MLHYILQTVAFQVLFLIIYDAFLKNETFFNWNRAYLLGTAFLSFILPFLKFESIRAIVPEKMVIKLPEVIIGEVTPVIMADAIMIPTEQISKHALNFTWSYVWIIGMILTTIILVYKIGKIISMLYKNPQRWRDDTLIVFLLNSSAAFSFFHYIFLGDNIKAEKKEHILQHEMVHVKEKHSLDLLVFEMLRIVFWFNPLLYMYQSRIATLHEFIADAKAVKYKGKSDYYQSLLSEVFQTQKISFINPFFHQSLIKKRILMLSKSKSKQIHLIKYVLLAPVVLVMLMYTSSYASKVKDPFPMFQYQELSFQELIDKYYNEMVAKNEDVVSAMETYKDIIGTRDSYIESKEIIAKRQAFMKYWRSKIDPERKVDDTSQNEKNVYKTYEDYLAYKKTDQAKRKWENDARNGELRLVVGHMTNLTDEENILKAKKMALIKNDDFYYRLKLTDGKVTTVRDFGKKNAQETTKSFESSDIEIPFSVIDEIPLYQGCEPSGSKDMDKNCTSQKVAEFVNKNYDVTLATQLGLTGKQRISVIFKIGSDGKVKDVMARAPHPALETEAIRVLKSMPDFTPGKQKGKVVTVPYSLPILFQVQDDVKQNEPIKLDNDEQKNKRTEESTLKDQNSRNDQEKIPSTQTVKGYQHESIEVPFAVIEEAPIFPSCEEIIKREDRKNCTSMKINEFINKNYNIDLSIKLGLTGVQRLTVIFKIDEDGYVTHVNARAPHPDLEKEAIRVIQDLPKMVPGKQKGKAVKVSYSLPIVFQAQ